MERRTMLAALKSAARRLRNRTARRSVPEAGEAFFALPRQDTARETVSRAAAGSADREQAVQRLFLPEGQAVSGRGTAALREDGAVVPAENAPAARVGSGSVREPAALPGGALSVRTAVALSGRESVLSGGVRALFRSGTAFAVSGAAVRRGEAVSLRAEPAFSQAAAAGEAFGRAARLGEAGAVTDGASVSRTAFVPAVPQSAAAAREDGEAGLRVVPQPMERVSSPALREADAGGDAPRTVRTVLGRGAQSADNDFWERWTRRFAGELHSSPEGVHG